MADKTYECFKAWFVMSAGNVPWGLEKQKLRYFERLPAHIWPSGVLKRKRSVTDLDPDDHTETEAEDSVSEESEDSAEADVVNID